MSFSVVVISSDFLPLYLFHVRKLYSASSLLTAHPFHPLVQVDQTRPCSSPLSMLFFKLLAFLSSVPLLIYTLLNTYVHTRTITHTSIHAFTPVSVVTKYCQHSVRMVSVYW